MLLYLPWFRLEAIPVPMPWGEVEIHPFGLLVATGVVLGAFLARRKAEKDGLHPETVMNLAGWVLIPAFVCAHVFDDLAYRPELVREQPLHLLMIWDGISSFGGFFGACLGAVTWTHHRDAPQHGLPRRGLLGALLWLVFEFGRALASVVLTGFRPGPRGSVALAFADPIAFSFPLGWMFGRLGCFGVHDHPGRVTDFFLGVADYQVGYPPYQVRHDLGLYEVIWSAATMALFVVLARRPRPRGFYLALLPILYAPIRFGLDFLRATDFDHADARYLGLTPGHYGAIALLVMGVLVALRVRARPWPEIPPWGRWPEPAPEIVPADEARSE